MGEHGSARATRRPAGLTGLTGRVVLVVSFVLLVSFGASGTWTAIEQYHMARETLGRQAAAIACAIPASSEEYLVRGNLDLVERLLERTMHSGDVLAIRVVDADGRLLSHMNRGPDRHPRAVYDPQVPVVGIPSEPTAIVVDTLVASLGRIIAWEPIVGARVLGWVRVDYGVEALAAARQRIVKTTLASALLSCLFSGLLLAALLRAPMRALREASTFAQSLERQTLARLPPLAGPSEIADLYVALNKAAERLGRHKAQIDESLFHLMQQEAELTASNNQLGALFAHSPEGLASIDASNRIALANEALARMLGMGHEQLEGQDAEALDAHLRRACVGPAGFAGLGTLFDPHGDTAKRAMRVTIDAAGRRVLEIVGVVSTSPSLRRLLFVRDLTRDIEVEQMKSEFLSTAAHELRTPMASIFGFTELLMTRNFTPDRRTLMLQKVHRQCRSMMGILDELLDLARIEARAGKDFELGPVDLRDLVEEALQDFRPPPGRADVEWSRPATKPAWVNADRKKLMQVMLNLLSNAYKYSPDGGNVRIALSHAVSRPQGLRHGIAVHDSGIGMTPAQAARIFERFYRADKSGRIAGTGLGMSIVREILTLLGGEIEVDSAHGVGTTMHVWLPPLMGALPERRDGGRSGTPADQTVSAS